MSEVVRISREGEVAIVEIDNPPVNATSQAVRRALLDAVQRAQSESETRAIVIAGAGRTFTAGGDISEFGKPPREPHLPDVINRIEESGKPIVVAWHGTALGGGCEIGLGAHKRIITKDGLIGLPEVKLGLLPGAGGTQRLPRLIGPVAALDLIATGRMVGAEEALRIGLVDAIAETDLRREAVALARSLIGQMQPRLSLQATPAAEPEAWQAMVDRVNREAKGRIAPLRAIELVSQSLTLAFGVAQANERRAFFELMSSDQSLALRHIFSAERETGKRPELSSARPRDISHIGIIGAGTMGSGIAVAFLDAGFRVTLVEADESALQAGVERVSGLYQRSIRSGRMDDATRVARLALLNPTTEMAKLAETGLVIEAVFEDMAIKLELMKQLGRLLPASTLVASNTSYLDLEQMADALPGPERFLGLHFFSPAHVMKLVEVVRARRTSPEAVATGLAIARKLKKIAVVTGVCEGFIGNRILAKFRAQCEFMLEEGALPREIDIAMEGFGLAMGPFAVQDLAGLDIAYARRKRLAATRTPDERDVPLVDRLVEEGRLGQKAGRGWYLYDNGKRSADPAVDAIIRMHAAGSGRPQRNFNAADIQNRIVAAMVNEGAKILGEGIAARAFEIDLVLVHGYGFPAWRGGPMHYADRVGLKNILSIAKTAAMRDGKGFEVAPLLEDLAQSQRRFADLDAN
ncbi:MAG: enoyl-CoA hydratase/isomerase family protein [Rhizobiales bacterium]|nr:enoyl-CoA hydratase/isomerase family protein [Hyphomicrobiales bacterium]